VYWNHFALSAEPFSLTPDPAFLYMSGGHSEALAALKLGLLERRGMVALIGEVGTGKTTLLYSLLAGLDTEIKTAYVSNTRLSFDGILRGALRDFGVKHKSTDRLEMLEALNEFLLECAENDTTAALIIDEAQNLSRDAFEEIRLLSNFETYTTKLLQIVLVGQPELATKLAERNLRQINERIAVRAYLNPLGNDQAHRYIQHRLESAGATFEVFEQGALRRIVSYARGVPRRINILCHNSLLHAYGRESETVTREIVEEVIRDQTTGGLKRFDSSPLSAPEPEPAKPPVARKASVWRSLTLWAAVGVALGLLQTWLETASFRELTRSARSWTVGVAAAAPRGSTPTPSSLASRSSATARRHERARQRRDVAVLSPRANKRLVETIAAIEAGHAPVPASGLAPIAAEPERSHTVVATAVPWLQPSVRLPAAAVERFEAPAPQIPRAEGTIAWTVSAPRGSSLYRLIINVYGEYNRNLLHIVREANPDIVDPNVIVAGQTIRFPKPQITSAFQADGSQYYE
jgi:type II secretory pathway predicted ATPase ExeA